MKLFTPLLMIFALGLGACGKQPVTWHGTDVSGVLPALEFELTDTDGEPVTAGDFHGRVTLVFFGFTNCPAICPATLGQLGVALAELGDLAEQVQVLLITVDPERDTPQALAEYSARFGPWLHGLTGPEETLRELNRAYKVDFQAQPAGTGGEYDVIHSSRVFAFDAQGQCRLLLPPAADTGAVVADLEQLIRQKNGI